MESLEILLVTLNVMNYLVSDSKTTDLVVENLIILKLKKCLVNLSWLQIVRFKCIFQWNFL